MLKLSPRLGVALLAALLGLAATAAHALEPPAASSESAVDLSELLGRRYEVRANQVYAVANNVELKLDLYLPRDATEAVPLVVNFHGGGWVAGDKEGSLLFQLRYLQMGFALANVGYRLARVSPAPAAVEDTRCALRWLQGRAKALKIDTNRVVLTGGSAGGHLALITGMLPPGNPFDRACATDNSTRWVSGTEPPLTVAAIVNYFGITDVEDLLSGPNAKHYAIEWLGAAPNREAIAKSVSPIHYVRAGLPPVIS
ncbi:MAG TPA: alpha/beta hydrolase, partial [Usitatibacteraceae bacterium]|nr:alpha/beta hydrolase [Usitatibacteraceae bacterium]